MAINTTCTITVAGLKPDLQIMGAFQRFNFTETNASFQLQSLFQATQTIPALMNLEFRNWLLNGYRLTHSTDVNGGEGLLKLSHFVNASYCNAIDIFTITPTDFIFNINPSGPEPTQDPHLATKHYVDTHGGGGTVSLQGDIQGSGQVGSPITTIFSPNPVFTGNESITIPVGTTAQRPTNPNAGTERFNNGA